MPTEAQDAKDARHLDKAVLMPADQQPITLARQVLWPVKAFGVALLSPAGIFAPRWFARQFAAQQVAVPVFLMFLLMIAWLRIWQQSTNFVAAMLLLGAFGLAVMWAIATVLTRSLAGRWDESARASSYKAGSLVFSFAGGFCMLLLLLFWFGADEAKQLILPYIKDSMLSMVTFRLGVLMVGLGLSVLAPIQIFRGLTSVGGGTIPSLEPLCRDCGYSLAGVAESYRAKRMESTADGAGPTCCSECGCELSLSLEPASRPGTAWTRGEDTSVRAWLMTLGRVFRRPGNFFAVLPLHSSREAAVRFWSYNLLAVLAFVAVFFAINHWIYVRWKIGMPVPISTYEPPIISTPAIMALCLPATLVGATMVMYTVVMAGALVLCSVAEFVWQRITLLRGRNMHPAGLLMVCYLSGHVFAILMAATAAFLAARLAVRAIPPDQAIIPWLTYERIIEIRTYAGGIAVGAGLVAAGLGTLWFRPVVTKAAKMMQYSNF